MVDGRALAVAGSDHAREVADEAVEVGELGVEVDLDVGVVDDALLEGGDEVGRPASPHGLVDLEHAAAQLGRALDEVDLVAHVAEGRAAVMPATPPPITTAEWVSGTSTL